MAQSGRIHRFRRRYLALIVGLNMLPAAHAMQELSDHSLSDTTGEGVALILDNFKMVFQGPNDVSAGSSYARGITDPGHYDTGFIRIIPTGENYNYQFNKFISPNYATYKINNEKSNYDKVYKDLLTKKISELRAKEEAALIAYEKSEASDSFWTERYLYYYNGINVGVLGENRDKWSRNYADNDMKPSDSQYKNLEAKVTKILTAKAIPLATAEALALAPQVLKQNFDKDILPGLIANKAGFENFLKAQNNKADIFVYGLALSGSNTDLNQRFSNVGFNWGTADNPWLVRAGTEENIKQFKDEVKPEPIGYLALEAPLAIQDYITLSKKNENGTTITQYQHADSKNNAISNLDSTFKLGFWTDIFARNLYSSAEVNPITGAPTTAEDLVTDRRLRLQFVANGLSLNGSQAKMFQTKQYTQENSQYNQTLGMALLLRVNTDLTPETVNNDHINNGKAIRISTAEKSNPKDGTISTPALDGTLGLAPTFSEKDGLILYSPNINLVLGNMYQPFIVGSEEKNIILEVTAIPNVPAIYNKIYTDYSSPISTKETLCNVASCGSNLVDIKGIKYQGNNATHSSITIGTVNYDPANNMIKANTEANASGVVFRDINGVSKNLGSVAIDGVLIQHLKFKTTGL